MKTKRVVPSGLSALLILFLAAVAPLSQAKPVPPVSIQIQAPNTCSPGASFAAAVEVQFDVPAAAFQYDVVGGSLLSGAANHQVVAGPFAAGQSARFTLTVPPGAGSDGVLTVVVQTLDDAGKTQHKAAAQLFALRD